MKRTVRRVSFVVALFLICLIVYLRKSSQLNIINVKNYGVECELAGSCGDIVSVNCKAEVDGPFYYVDKNTGEILEYCGGYCMMDSLEYCQHCPPEN
jgi:hypothetical protein